MGKSGLIKCRVIWWKYSEMLKNDRGLTPLKKGVIVKLVTRLDDAVLYVREYIGIDFIGDSLELLGCL